jgi:hypothetical protein
MIDGMDPKELRRREKRYRVIKRAKIVFGSLVIDCIVLNISKNGACVKTLVEVAVPEHVVLSFPNGGAFRAHRRWSKDHEVGFSLNGPAPLTGQDRLLAIAAFDALSMNAPQRPISILRDAGFFDDPALGSAADEAEAAYSRMLDVLQARITLRSMIPNE